MSSDTTARPKISVVILNYNGRQLPMSGAIDTAGRPASDRLDDLEATDVASEKRVGVGLEQLPKVGPVAEAGAAAVQCETDGFDPGRIVAEDVVTEHDLGRDRVVEGLVPVPVRIEQLRLRHNTRVAAKRAPQHVRATPWGAQDQKSSVVPTLH